MKEKKWIKQVFKYILVITLSMGMFNYIVDPFHQYRIKTFYPIAYISKLERYINPGFAKNFDYDTVILGSSTSENFVLSDVKKILGFKSPIKLTISGTSAYEESLILQTALKHKNVKNVLYGLDTFLFWGDPKRIRHGKKTFPFYLYDDNIFNDCQYIFSFDTVIKSIKTLTAYVSDNKNSVRYDYNRMYQWQDTIPKNHFSKRYVLQQWENRKEHNIGHRYDNTFEFYKNSFDINFLQIIKENKSIHFIIYFPPYSILKYKFEQEEHIFKDRLKFKKYIFEKTKNLSNVEIYDFQIAKHITHNLSNYHDLDHYHQKINRWILEQIKNNSFKVTEKNIDSIIQTHQKQVIMYKINGVAE